MPMNERSIEVIGETLRMRDEMTFYNIACEIVFRGVNLTESIISRFRKYREK